MAQTDGAVNPGLEGVVVAETRLSDVDGERGKLVIAGEDVETLAGRDRFEAVCARLWAAAGLPPTSPDEVSRGLGLARVAAFALLPQLGSALKRADGMEALRAAVAQLSASATDELTAAINVTGASATFAAAWARQRAGQSPIAPDPQAAHSADFLRMLSGETPTPGRAAAIDTYFVTVVDHGLNASTFAARVVASTGSDLISAIVAGICALKGPLHGGAPGPVLDMLDAVGSAPKAKEWLRAELDAGRRIMGMGHRIYRTRDPRAAVLERAIERLEQHGGASARLSLARAVEREAEGLLQERQPNRPLKANVEFYTATLLEAVGLPRELFSVTFALSRMAGWSAHVVEQRRTGRLIRPASRYLSSETAARL